MDRGCGRLREAAGSTIRSPPGEGKALKSGALEKAFAGCQKQNKHMVLASMKDMMGRATTVGK